MTANQEERNRIITLLTDFETADGYVAAMKGVILSQTSAVCLVDAAHDIRAQDVEGGAWAIHQYRRYFPAGTIHVAVVDPGVGSERAALLAEVEGQTFLAPDNGLLSWVFRTAGSRKVGRIRRDVHHPDGLSPTFHGRDVFAYAAGRLAAGKARPNELAEATEDYIVSPWAVAECRADGLYGRVVHVDRFGNLITNIAREDLIGRRQAPPRIHAGECRISGLASHYAEAAEGRPLALINSAGLLEIAVNRGSARDVLGLRRGDAIRVEQGSGG